MKEEQINSVCLFCDFYDENIIDMKKVILGNTGMGGTQFLFLLLSSGLSKIKNIKINLVVVGKLKLENQDFEYNVFDNNKQALNFIKEKKFNTLIIRDKHISMYDEFIKKNKIKCIVWGHNHISWNQERSIYKNEHFIKVVCVSQQQFINMKFVPSYIQKYTFINNIIGEKNIDIRPVNYNLNFYYIGGIEPSRGIFESIKFFNKIYKTNNKSHYYLFGAYNSLRANKIKTGDRGITFSKYEKKLFNYINKNNLNNNVHFMGVKDANYIEKFVKENGGYGLFNFSKLRSGETFCLSALELEKYGIPIISKNKKDGLNTTVIDYKTGFLFNNEKEVLNNIFYINSNPHLYNNLSINCQLYSKVFNYKNFIEEWEKLIFFVCNTDTQKLKRKVLIPNLKTIISVFKNKIIYIFYNKYSK